MTVTVAIVLGLCAGLIFFHEELGLQQRVTRFLSSVTSRTQATDYDEGQNVYAIMMDAGSTGSRILVFTFKKSPSDGSLQLLEEFYKEVKPGISSYATEPQKAAESINGLLADAKRIIPPKEWSNTPLSLKATAGLRLLPTIQGENLLNSIRDVFEDSGFSVSSDSVSIIDGTSEGLFLWTTINFLLGKLHGDLNETVAVVDMGGGSTQVAFVPLDPLTIQQAAPEDVTAIQLLGQPAKFYIHSYLGLGLMSMRLAILQGGSMRLAVLQGGNKTFKEDGDELFTPYFHEDVTTEWEFQGRRYQVSGLKSPKDSTEESQKEDSWRHRNCRNLISTIMEHKGVQKIAELQHRNLFAVSYYFDRAVEASLISEKVGGFVHVHDYCTAATQACEIPNQQQPFACIDLSYLCTILEGGLGLSTNQIVNLKKKLDGHETSWALGAALFDLDRKATNQH